MRTLKIEPHLSEQAGEPLNLQMFFVLQRTIFIKPFKGITGMALPEKEIFTGADGVRDAA